MKKIDRRVFAYIEFLLEHHRDMEPVEVRRKYLIAMAKSSNHPVEKAAIDISTDTYLCNVDLTRRIIQSVLDKLDSVDTELINLVYFRRSHTVTGAGMKVGLAKSAAYQHRNAIIREIALLLGFIAP